MNQHDQLQRTLMALAAIPDEEWRKAEALFRPRSIPAGVHFAEAGKRAQTLAFVITGLLRLYYLDHSGNDYTKSFCAENSFVGAYSSLLLGEPSRLFIVTLEDSILLEADYDAYQQLAQSHICWQMVNRQLAESLFIKKEKRESELLLDDATTRYLTFQAEFPGLESRLKQYHVASYLGITPVTLSRIRAQLQQN